MCKAVHELPPRQSFFLAAFCAALSNPNLYLPMKVDITPIRCRRIGEKTPDNKCTARQSARQVAINRSAPDRDGVLQTRFRT